MAISVFSASRAISLILRNSYNSWTRENSLKILSTLPVAAIQIRHSSYGSSHQVRDINEYPEVEIIKNPPEWKFVEKVLPIALVPSVKPKEEYPSGWKPPKPIDINAKYYVPRTKNHMIPVYLHRSFNGGRMITVIRRIEGDIWSLEKDLRVVVEKVRKGKLCASRVNELSCQIFFHGDYVNAVKEFLQQKGF